MSEIDAAMVKVLEATRDLLAKENGEMFAQVESAEARAERYRKALEAVIKEMDEGRIVSASGDYIQSRGPWVVAEAARAALRGEG